MEYEKIPIHLKMTLTIKEAAEYSNIGINKIEKMLREPNCPFVLYVGTKKLVKRKEFEEFISKKLIIGWQRLAEFSLRNNSLCDTIKLLHWLFFSWQERSSPNGKKFERKRMRKRHLPKKGWSILREICR